MFLVDFWYFLDFLKNSFFDFFEGLVFMARKKILGVFFWILVPT